MRTKANQIKINGLPKNRTGRNMRLRERERESGSGRESHKNNHHNNIAIISLGFVRLAPTGGTFSITVVPAVCDTV